MFLLFAIKFPSWLGSKVKEHVGSLLSWQYHQQIISEEKALWKPEFFCESYIFFLIAYVAFAIISLPQYEEKTWSPSENC